ncbi:MAG: MIP/aquaporin family protein [Candidatus Nanopelagicales bacterium]
MSPIVRRFLAEFLGTGLLVAAVVGSGIMATNLTDDRGVELLINALATVAALGVLIWTLGPISGAHFNPAVSLIAVARREIPPGEAAGYVIVQIAGAIAGATLANVMFSLPAWSASTHTRTSTGLWIGEIVATAGLLLVIGAITRTGHAHLGPVLVPAWIGAAYFFTASTSFANPAVTIGRAFSDTFAGISPASVPLFIVFQLIGAVIGAALTEVLYPRKRPQPLDLPEAVHDTHA